MLKDSHQKYLILNDKIRNCEESRIFYLKSHLEKFNKIIEEIEAVNKEFTTVTKSTIIFSLESSNIFEYGEYRKRSCDFRHKN